MRRLETCGRGLCVFVSTRPRWPTFTPPHPHNPLSASLYCTIIPRAQMLKITTAVRRGSLTSMLSTITLCKSIPRSPNTLLHNFDHKPGHGFVSQVVGNLSKPLGDNVLTSVMSKLSCWTPSILSNSSSMIFVQDSGAQRRRSCTESLIPSTVFFDSLRDMAGFESWPNCLKTVRCSLSLILSTLIISHLDVFLKHDLTDPA